jgi:GNAT superfamily N-acetyltransferase
MTGPNEVAESMNKDETGIVVRRLTSDLEEDFYRYHGREPEGWCHCAAWIVPTWIGWSERTAEENRAVRGEQFADGKHDGYLLYADGEVVGWCQAAPISWLPKLADLGVALESAEEAEFAVSCFSLRPEFRGQGFAHILLAEVLDDLATRGVKRVQAFPRRAGKLSSGEVWTGPESLFEKAGFTVARDHPERPVLVKEL